MDELKKEYDNLVYTGIALALIVAMSFVDKSAAITLGSALGGALLVKIKGGDRGDNDA